MAHWGLLRQKKGRKERKKERKKERRKERKKERKKETGKLSHLVGDLFELDINFFTS